ncbi:hypothetical protein DICPUDRAFT_92021 [Dictyostelium purpureum]|uniref:Glutathione S-transferase n=1 Tax=Dictyostelium purpureum TaxID=5786 RepID=F0ZKN5_DICPU|nr:uncharacterized protein DICPUDRAFT_92021 [Dictyostelium purpureum]EGC35491.1 hypothetical protein DICPUDRAFT_92021 [Dictyostelium purpureum]|eukprot:XP_003287970.1 hypothetical protein DICPUDRAFT_92021 [Dictyostelium purpureum]
MSIDFYTSTTPNGYKVEIFLNEANIQHNYHAISLQNGDQFKPDFLKISPNNKIPAIQDNTVNPPIPVFESAAIMIYLSQKYQLTELYPDYKTNPALNTSVNEWLFWQMSAQGPMIGQYNYFKNRATEKVPHAIERFETEVKRLYTVLEKQLSTNKYVAGDQFTIADICSLGWSIYALKGYYEIITKETYPNVFRWLNESAERPSVKKVLDKIQPK